MKTIKKAFKSLYDWISNFTEADSNEKNKSTTIDKKKIPIPSKSDKIVKQSEKNKSVGYYVKKIRYTYGVAVDKPIKYVNIQKLPDGHLDRYGYLHPTTKKKHVANLFSAMIRKDDVAPGDEPVTRTFRRFHSAEKKCRISIYRSEKKYPLIVEGQPLIFLYLTFPDDYQELEFEIHFYFGDTAIKVFFPVIDQQIRLQYDSNPYTRTYVQPTIEVWQCFMCSFASTPTTVDVCSSCKCTRSASKKIKLQQDKLNLQQDKIKQLNQENQNLKQMNKSLQIHAYKVEHESQIKKQFIYRRAQQNKFNTGANDLSHQIHNIGIVMSEFEEWSYQS
eukprot:402215_1